MSIIYQPISYHFYFLFSEEEKDVFNAVSSGDLEKLKMLLEKREDNNPVISIADDGVEFSVLDASAYLGKVEIIRWYNEDLHLDDINPLDSSGRNTPMAYAAQQGQLNVVKYIESVQGGYKVLIKFLIT